MTEELQKSQQGASLEQAEEQKPTIKILPDACWAKALIDEKDPHHRSVEASFGAIKPYRPDFYVPHIVFMETMSSLIRAGGLTAKECTKRVTKTFGEELHARLSSELRVEQIVAKYKTFSRTGIRKLKTQDFYIVTEGMSLNAKILTCDEKMYKKVLKIYKRIYFLGENKQVNDLWKL